MAGVKIHRKLTGAQAVHPFAFISSTDPALDPNNEVTANKAWIDTNGNILKIRNASNTGWDVVIGGGSAPLMDWQQRSYTDGDMLDFSPPPQDVQDVGVNAWGLVNFI